MAVEFHRLAAEELREARDWYLKRSPRSAARFLTAIESALEWGVAHFSELQLASHGCRWIRLKRFPYSLIMHQDEPGELLIVAVSHTRRRPTYWKRRI